MARLRWPVAPWAALVTAALTAAIAPWSALTPAPAVETPYAVSVEVEDGLPSGLTPQKIEAALEDVRVSVPLTVRVLPASQELPTSAEPGQLVMRLGVPIDGDFPHSRVRSPSGAPAGAIYAASSALDAAISLGAEATAVSAAVRSWDAATREGTAASPVRIAATAIGAIASLAFLAWFLIRRRTWKDRAAALGAARSALASVVVELDAIEAGSATLPASAATTASSQFEELRALTLDLARREDEAVLAVSTPARANSGSGRAVRALFVADAAAAVALAEQLSLASSFLAERAGALSTWDRVIAPTVLATTGLLLDVRSAPAAIRAVAPGDLQANLDALLALGEDIEHSRLPSERVAARLAQVEREIVDSAEALARRLRGRGASRELRDGGAQTQLAGPGSSEAMTDPLRADLGLPPSVPALALDRARGAVAAYLGHPEPPSSAVVLGAAPRPLFESDPRVDRAPQTKRREASRANGKAPRGLGSRVSAALLQAWPTLSPKGTATRQVALGCAAVTVVVGAAWLASGALTTPPLMSYQRTGSGDYRLGEPQLLGRDLGISKSALSNAASTLSVPIPVDLVVLGVSSPFATGDRVVENRNDPETYELNYSVEERRTVFREALATLPQLIDPATGDLAAGKALIVVDAPAGRTGGAIIATGFGVGQHPLAHEQIAVNGDLNPFSLLSEKTQIALEHALASEEQALAVSISDITLEEVPEGADPSRRWVIWALLVAGAAAGAAVIAGLIVGASGLLRGMGRLGTSLRRSGHGLRTLSLELDDARLNAVAVLGGLSTSPQSSPLERTAPAVQDQRLHEAWAVQALRIHEQLGALRGAQRRRPDALQQALLLEQLVDALLSRDHAVAQAATLRLSHETNHPREAS